MVAAAPWQLSPQELHRIAAKTLRKSLPPQTGRTASKSGPAEQTAPQPAGDDDAHALADSYAQAWNNFVVAGMPPSEHEIAEADAELAGSQWKLQQDTDGKWMIVAVPEQSRPPAVQQFSRDGWNGPVAMDLINARLLAVPDIRQEDDYSCGAACAMSVGGYFGVGPKTLEEWKKELGTDVEESTRPTAIVSCFRKLGLHVEDRDHLTINDLTDYWKRGIPVICCIQEYGVPDKQASFEYGHYVVVIGAAIGQVFVQDPSIDNVLQRPGGDVKAKKDDIDADQTAGRMMIDATTWMKCWHDQDADGIKYINYGIAVGPPTAQQSQKQQPSAPLQFSRNAELRQRIADAAAVTDRTPTEGQKKAGNYQKGRVGLHGLTFVIENPRGSTRSGVNKAGKPWSVRMADHYGYISRTESDADGDAVDVFLGPNPESEIVFIVDQLTLDGRFDEHKVMMGFLSEREAKEAYLDNYSKGWKGFGGIAPMTMQEFKKWLAKGDTGRPAQGQAKIRFARDGFVLQFAAMRAPYGSGPPGSGTRFHIQGGKPEGYLKSQFIPGGVIDKLKQTAASGNTAAKQQVAELEQGHAAGQATQQKNAESRPQRDLSQLKGRLAAHAGAQPLDEKSRQQAVRSYRALRAHHGDLAMHRLDELSEQTQSRLDKVDKDLTRTAEGTPEHSQLLQIRQRLQGEMAKFHHMHQLAEAEQKAPAPQAQPPAAPPSQLASAEKASPEVLAELSKLGPFSIRDDGMLIGKLDKSLTPEARADLRAFGQILEGNEGMSYVDRARAFAQRQQDWKHRIEQPRLKEQERAETAGLPPAHPEEGETYNVNTSELAIAPELFQYKVSGIDPDKGITEELKNVTVWDKDQVGVIAVWRDPATGKDYVVNGHHRYELAERLNVPTLPVRYIQLPTATEARAKGALLNIGDGRGTAIDAAKFIRDSGITPEDMKARGISLEGKMAADGIALSKLSDDAFARVAQGHLDENTAVIVANQLDNPTLQDQFFSYLDRKHQGDAKFNPKPDVIAEMARRVGVAPTVKSDQKLLFGDNEEESTFEQVAELTVALKRHLGREQGDYRAVSSERRAGNVAGAGNVINTQENKRLAQKAGERKNVTIALLDKNGPIADTINDFAVKLKNANTKGQQDAVRKEFLAAVQPAIDHELAHGGLGKPGQSEQATEASTTNAGGEGESTVGSSGNTEAGRTAEAAPVSPDQGRGDTGETGLSEVPKEPEQTPEPTKPAVQPSAERRTSPPAPSKHPPEKINAALDRYKNRDQTAQGGGIFGGEDLQSREGFGKLPDNAPVVFTSGEFQGKTGKIVHDQDPTTGETRIVAEVDGRPGLVPVTPDAVEPLDKNYSWRTEGGGAGAVHKQGGLFTADQFLPRREKTEEQSDNGKPAPEPPKEQAQPSEPAKQTEKKTEHAAPSAPAARESEHPLLSHLSAKKPRSLKKIAERAGIDRAEAAKSMKQLIRDGRVKVESGDDGDRYVLSSEKSPVSAPPAKEPPARPAAPATKPQPPSRTPPPRPPATATPAPTPKPPPETVPEWKNRLEIKPWANRAETARKFLEEHNLLPAEEKKGEDYNPGVHERQEPTEAPIRLISKDHISPEAYKVVQEEQEVAAARKKGRGRPSKKAQKILSAAAELTELRRQLSTRPEEDAGTVRQDLENELKQPDTDAARARKIRKILDKNDPSLDERIPTLHQEKRTLADQLEKAIATRNIAELSRLKFQRMQLEAVLQFMRTVSFSVAG